MSFAPPPPPSAPPGPQVPALGGCVPASPGRRAGAAVLDGLLIGIPSGVGAACTSLGTLQESVGLMVVGALLSIGGLVGLVAVGVVYGRTGLSPGKKAMGLRLVDVRTGHAPGIGAAWLRYLLAGLGASVVAGLVVAIVQILQNPRGDRRTWYDTTTNVALLDVVAGRDPVLHPVDGAPRPVARPVPVAPPTPEQEARLAAVPTLVTMEGAPLHPSTPPPPPPGPPAPAAPPAGAVAEQDDIEETRVTAAAPRPAAAAVEPVAVLTFDSGAVEKVSGRGVVGRKPRLADGATDGTAITVPDDTRTVSKTHLELVVEASGLRVTDLWSTNGSTIIHADGNRTVLDSGTPVLAPYGCTVTVGDHWFTLERFLSPQDAFDDAGDTMLRGPR